MVKLVIGDGSTGGGDFRNIEPQRDVEMLLKDALFVPADERFNDRIEWQFELLDGPDLADEDVGYVHKVWTDMPQSKSGEVSPRSNLYEVLEGVSGGTFDPKDAVDTDDYVGKKYIGDFKRVERKERDGNAWVTKRDENGAILYKSKLVNIHPPRPARPPRRTRRVEEPVEQDEFDWDDED